MESNERCLTQRLSYQRVLPLDSKVSLMHHVFTKTLAIPMNNPRKISIIAINISLLWAGIDLYAQDRLYEDQFPLPQVTLLQGPLRQARDLNIEVLLKYDVDRLLAPYRAIAGLPAKADSYANWAGLDGHVAETLSLRNGNELCGYRNSACKGRMEYMLSELAECQKANATNHAEWGVGYVGGFPNSEKLWSAFKDGDFKVYRSSWAPFYNLHKMYAGLRDAWLYCDDEEAKTMFLKFCDWALNSLRHLAMNKWKVCFILNMVA